MWHCQAGPATNKPPPNLQLWLPKVCHAHSRLDKNGEVEFVTPGKFFAPMHNLCSDSLSEADSGDLAMAETPNFKAAFPYQQDVLALPVTNLDTASAWYSKHFGMVEVERHDTPVSTVILERDGTKIGFAINGCDATQDGAAILVSNIRGMKKALESRGVQIGNWRVDERDGQKLQVFVVVAPDGLCYYFHEPI